MANNIKYNYEGKVALVTGAASGLGWATAKAFAEAGASVVLADINEEALKNIHSEFNQSGYKSISVVCDVTNEAQVESLLNQTVSAFGRLDLAFNNAGIILPPTATTDLAVDKWNRVLAINLTGIWLCMKYELNQMLKQGEGAIVNCSSMAGLQGAPAMSAYAASKHGILGLTKSTALEYVSKGIRINAVCPGMVDTPMKNDITGGNVVVLAEMAKMVPAGRFCKPEEIASTVLWLCSDDAGMVIGQSLAIDGGITIG